MRTETLVSDQDRFAAAALQVDRLAHWIDRRTAQRGEALPDEPTWVHVADSAAGIRSEAPELFPGRRSAWVR